MRLRIKISSVTGSTYGLTIEKVNAAGRRPTLFGLEVVVHHGHWPPSS